MPFFRRSAVHPPSPLNGPAQFRHGSMPFLNGFHTAHGKAGVGRASSADHRGSLELDLAGKSQHIFEAGTHWLNDEAPARFREVEFMRRRVNRQQLWAGAPLDLHVAPESRRVYDLCASHCWRNTSTQEFKRRLFAEISRGERLAEDKYIPGMTYWADFLDLQADGPMMWRDEVLEGIRDSSKFVAFIDEDYLMSFNCIAELQAAISMNKIIVPVVLDDYAWTLLTSGPVAGTVIWDHSSELRSYEGIPVQGGVFDMKLLQNIFTHLGSIQLCGCRESDVALYGLEAVLRDYRQFLKNDIPYLKAFTDLELKASHWEAKGKPRSGSTILHAQEVRQWHDWCSQAMRYRKEQLPTDLQLEYVRVSDAHHRSHKRLRAGVLGVAVVLIVIGTSVSIAMAMRASHLRLVAEEEAFKADRAMKLALLGEKAALQQRRIAEHEKRAVLVWNLLNAAGQPSRDSFMALKLLRQALAILPKDGRPDLAWACLDLYRRLLANDHGSIPCTGEVRLPNASAVLNILLDQSGSGLAITIPFYGGSTVSVWNISHAGSDTPVSVLKGGHPALLSFMVFGPPGSDLIATAGMDGSIALWRKVFEGWEVASVLRNHTGSIWALDVSRDGSMLASCQMGLPDTAIRIWHGWPGLSSSKEGVSTGRVTLLGGHADWVQSVAWRPDNSALASSSSDWTVRLWQVTPRGELVGSSVLHRGNTVLGLMAWHPDGSKLAVGGRDKSVTLIDMTDDTSRVLKLPSTITAGRLPAYLDWQAESPRAPMGGGLSVAISVLDNSIMLFPMTGDGYELPRVQLLSSEDRGAIEYISFSPDGEWMLAVRLDGLIDLYSGGKWLSVQLDSPSLPRWNDDGITVLQNSDKGPQFLIFSFGGNLSTLDIEGAPTVAIDIPAWHSSGRVAFTVKSKMEVRVWNVFDNNTVDEEQIISVPDTPRNEYAMPTGKLQDQAPSYLASTGTAASRTVYSPNGRFLATSGFLYTVVRIIDLSGTGNVQVVPTSPAAWQIAWSPDSHLVAFATSTFQAEIWFVPSDGGALQLQQALGPGRSAYGMAWNPSGTSLAMGLDDGSIQIWEDPLQGVADVHSLQHPISSGRMVLLAYSPDGQMLLSSSLEGTLVIWRLDMAGRGSNVHTMQSKSSPPLITRWMPPTQGRPYGRLTTSASDGSIRVWDPHASSVSGVSRLRGHSSWVYVVAYSPDGMYLASGSKDGTVRVWQAATGYALAAELQPLVFRGSGGWVVTLVWMRSTSYSDIRIASGHADGTVLLFECDGSCARGSQPAKRTVLEGHEGCIQALQRSPDGTYLASSAADGTTRLWQLPHLEGTGGHVLDGQDGAVTSLMFSPDSRHLATASTLSTVCIWRLQGTGATLLTTLRGHVGRVNAVVYSPDGELLLTASDDETLRTYLIDNSDGSASLKQVVTSHSGPVISVVISQDSSLIATGSRDGAVRLHRRASPDAAVVLVNQAGKQVKKLALSQDGLKVAAIVAASSRGGSVCVWDVTKALESLVVFPTGAQEAEFSSRQELLGYGNARLGALDFSLDGRNVAYGGSNFDVVVTTLLDVDEAFQGLEQVMVGNISLTIHNVLELDLPLEVLGQ